MSSTDLLIFRHEAQIVISNKNYTDEMADPNSDGYKQIERDMCDTVSTSTRYVYVVRVRWTGTMHRYDVRVRGHMSNTAG